MKWYLVTWDEGIIGEFDKKSDVKYEYVTGVKFHRFPHGYEVLVEDSNETGYYGLQAFLFHGKENIIKAGFDYVFD